MKNSKIGKNFIVVLCSIIVTIVIISTILIVRNLLITYSSKGTVQNDINDSLLEQTESLNPLVENKIENIVLDSKGENNNYNYCGSYKIENKKYVFGKKDEYENVFQLIIQLFKDNSVIITPKYSTITYLGSYYGKYEIKNNKLKVKLEKYKGTQQIKDSTRLENVDLEVSEEYNFKINSDNTLTSEKEICNMPAGSKLNVN